MKLLFTKGVLVALTLISSVSVVFAQSRKKATVNDHWYFIKTDENPDTFSNFHSEGTIVNLPHSWNDKDVLSDGERGYYRGATWYGKQLSIQKEDQKKYYLHFEGANQETTLYVNNTLVGNHKGGYSAFRFDITPLLNDKGNNFIKVKVDNSHNPDIPPLSADFTFFGGIYRDLYLIETADIHFDMEDFASTGIYISTPEVSTNSASLKLRTLVKNDSDKKESISIVHSVLDGEGSEIFSTEQKVVLKAREQKQVVVESGPLKNIKLWSPDSPYLYRVISHIVKKGEILDEVDNPLGFRWFSFDAKKGFFLNGESLKLMGANRHQDYWGEGNALSDDLHRSDMQLLKDMGGNFIRLAHYPQDPAILEAADEIGLLVWEETPLVNEVTLSEAHDENSKIMVKEMVRQHYNHPSIIMWGYMNEIYWAHRFLDEEVVDAHTKATLQLAQKLEDIVREEDPSRYTAMACHNYPLYESSEITKIPMIVSWNLYHGWYYDTFEDFGKFMDRQHNQFPERIHFISEYGAGSDVRLHSTKPERFDFTVEGQKRFLESFLKQILERPFIAGASVWNLIDFNSERRLDAIPHLNSKGLAEADRTPKDTYYLFKAALSDDAVVKIAETNWVNRSGYPEKGETEVFQPVQVYSNASEVELFQNGESLGVKKIDNFSATWDVLFSDGSHEFMATADSFPSDKVFIDFKWIPFYTNKAREKIDISLNAGSNYSFFDHKGNVVWISDKQYESGSWGALGGSPLYISKKIGTKEDILTVTDFIPLYQTMQVGADGYQFDVPEGKYEVELLFVEPFPKSRRFVDGNESPDHSGGVRIFDVLINEDVVLEKLDLLKTYGYNYPFRKKWEIKVKDDEGIKIQFKEIKGESIISGIKIRQIW